MSHLDAHVAATEHQELGGYKRRYNPLALFKVFGTMYSTIPLNWTPAEVLLTFSYHLDAKGKSMVMENIVGCCFEPLRPMKENSIALEGGQVNCLAAVFSTNSELRWDEHKTPNFMKDKRYMGYQMRKMLCHTLQIPFCSSKLHTVGM